MSSACDPIRFLEASVGLLDKFKKKAAGAVKGHEDQIKSGVDKAGDVVDDKTGHKYTDKIETGEQKVSEAVDKLDDQ
jgi:hypothetical protein